VDAPLAARHHTLAHHAPALRPRARGQRDRDEVDLIWNDFGDLRPALADPAVGLQQLNEIILGYDNQRQLAA